MRILTNTVRKILSVGRLQGIICGLLLLCCCSWQKTTWEEPWGKDKELVHFDRTEKKTQKTSYNPLYHAGILMIQFHQTFISPMNQDRSNFRPTSSQYAMDAIKRHGFVQGFIMGCDRLMRENDDEWVYNQKEINGILWKYDPVE
ncbi:MAG: putative membrane protein insertion efficiency factor [Chlamydiae bacterium]|nr:putative membrane protein insertion efficiency factor [Chlamydiota bacterium]